MITDIEAGHHVVAEASYGCEPEQAAVEIFGLLQVVNRNRPVSDAFDFERSHKNLII
jgi:hypothetical protein